MDTIRVAQWATGAVGREALLGILEAPGLELVGVRVTSGDKDGADAGALVGRDPVGILATTSTERLLATRPHCVVYTPRTPDVGEVGRAAARRGRRPDDRLRLRAPARSSRGARRPRGRVRGRRVDLPRLGPEPQQLQRRGPPRPCPA